MQIYWNISLFVSYYNMGSKISDQCFRHSMESKGSFGKDWGKLAVTYLHLNWCLTNLNNLIGGEFELGPEFNRMCFEIFEEANRACCWMKFMESILMNQAMELWLKDWVSCVPNCHLHFRLLLLSRREDDTSMLIWWAIQKEWGKKSWLRKAFL